MSFEALVFLVISYSTAIMALEHELLDFAETCLQHWGYWEVGFCAKVPFLLIGREERGAGFDWSCSAIFKQLCHLIGDRRWSLP